jgi:hypothetical protein
VTGTRNRRRLNTSRVLWDLSTAVMTLGYYLLCVAVLVRANPVWWAWTILGALLAVAVVGDVARLRVWWRIRRHDWSQE